MEKSILQLVLEVIIQVLLPIVLAMAVAWLRQQYAKVKAEIPAEQFEFASSLAMQLVLAAEQNGLTGAIKNEAEAKKEWVITRLSTELRKHGVKLDLPILSDLIESAVHEAFKL